MQGILIFAVAIIVGPLLVRLLVTRLENNRTDKAKPSEKHPHTVVSRP